MKDLKAVYKGIFLRMLCTWVHPKHFQITEKLLRQWVRAFGARSKRQRLKVFLGGSGGMLLRKILNPRCKSVQYCTFLAIKLNKITSFFMGSLRHFCSKLQKAILFKVIHGWKFGKLNKLMVSWVPEAWGPTGVQGYCPFRSLEGQSYQKMMKFVLKNGTNWAAIRLQNWCRKKWHKLIIQSC